MNLFYKQGACSLASHIVLIEVGAKFNLDEVDTVSGQTKSGRDYRQINSKGNVPALELESGEVLTEGAAILQYIADQHCHAQLAPATGTIERARVQEHLNYVGSELHKAFSPLFSATASEQDKAKAELNVAEKFDYVEELFEDGRSLLVGDNFTVADAYLFVVSNWSNFVGIDLVRWPRIAAFVDRIASRPAVKLAMQSEGLA